MRLLEIPETEILSWSWLNDRGDDEDGKVECFSEWRPGSLDSNDRGHHLENHSASLLSPSLLSSDQDQDNVSVSSLVDNDGSIRRIIAFEFTLMVITLIVRPGPRK